MDPNLRPILPPALAELPGHWLTLSAEGHIVAAHPLLAAQLGLRADGAPRRFASTPSPRSRAAVARAVACDSQTFTLSCTAPNGAPGADDACSIT